MYESPVDICCTDYVAKQIESDRDDAVMLEITEQYGVNVDKYELTRALAYDRGQYDKGYKDGYDEAIRQFTDFLKEKFGLYLVAKPGEEVADLLKDHPDLFCLGRKKEDE
jgi:hypothetical protein